MTSTLRVFKYPFRIGEKIEIGMPIGARVLSVQTHHGQPCLWALVDPAARSIVRQFRLVGTGPVADDSIGPYVGTFQMFDGQRVWHLFEVA